MQRTLLGIVAAGLLISSLVVSLAYPDSSGYLAFSLKAGTIFAVLWLALPDAQRGANPYLITGIIASAIILVVRPKLFPIALVVMVAMYFLRPRQKIRSPK